jgi:RimJ/RimL family protein N-acetyltransferase
MDPMLMDIAEEFCTERLRIRVPLPGDGKAVFGAIQASVRELGARRVEIRCDTLNLKSKAIPERLEFALEGTLRNEDVSVDGGRLRDTHIFAKVRQ